MTKKRSIALIDYGMGNLRSVAKALEVVGCSVRYVSQLSQLKFADALVLPGVGAFALAVKNLKNRKLFDSIIQWIDQKKPFLGICLGYQLLFESSEEGQNGDRNTNGLGIFRGRVQKFDTNKKFKIPHIGWNQILIHKSQVNRKRSKTNDFKLGIYNGISNSSYFYFVHSYFPVPGDQKLVVTTTRYGTEFVSSISKGKLFACQFHPEKSGKNGLKLLKNFVNLC